MSKKKPSPKKRKALTPADLGLVDDVKLSASFANVRHHYKVVENNVLGYYVAGGTHAPVRIAPIYRATIYYVQKKVTHMTSSYEIGPYLNPMQSADVEPDIDGDALAYLAATALGALERHGRLKAARSKPRRGARS
jgi:hypothetical protein